MASGSAANPRHARKKSASSRSVSSEPSKDISTHLTYRTVDLKLKLVGGPAPPCDERSRFVHARESPHPSVWARVAQPYRQERDDRGARRRSAPALRSAHPSLPALGR